MSNVVNMQEYRNKKNAILCRVELPSEVRAIHRMALSPYKFGVIILCTDNGVYEWDTMHETLEKVGPII